MTKHSQETIILAIQKFYSINNRIPKQSDFSGNNDYPGKTTVCIKFGSWNNAIIAAGLKTDDWTDEELLGALKDFKNSTGKIPGYNDFVNKRPSARTIELRFGSWNNALKACDFHIITKYNIRWTDEDIIKAIQIFVDINNKIPECRDFDKDNKYPSQSTVISRFKTWNNAIALAGFTPKVSGSLGVNTVALDGHAYRSKSEAVFVNKFLYNKYEYYVEPPYPQPYYKFYDWFVPALELYIELDGGIRATVIEEKRKINKNLNRFCIYPSIKKISLYNNLSEVITHCK